jgi:hypothetical protein
MKIINPTRRPFLFIARPPKKFQGEAQTGGQKGKGSGRRNFCPPVVRQRRAGGGKRFRNSALAGRQNRKIFVSLIEKIFARGRSKNVKKIFLFCSPSGERKRWAGLSPYGRQLKIKVRIFVKKSSDFVQKVPLWTGSSILESRSA